MESQTWKTRGRWIGLGIGVAGVGVTLAAIPFIIPGFRRYCLPYIPASDAQVRAICTIMKNRCGPVIDLGSGDGRVVIALAQQGHYATGCELNYWLVLVSRLKGLLKGVQRNTEFIHSDLWKVDLSKYNNIIFFGVDEMMKPLGDKIQREAPPTAVVISSRFKFPQWTHVNRRDIHEVWEYHMTEKDVIKSQICKET